VTKGQCDIGSENLETYLLPSRFDPLMNSPDATTWREGNKSPLSMDARGAD
jgi:hypothetical protein